MPHMFPPRTSRLILASFVSGGLAVAVAAGCSDDESPATPRSDSPPVTSLPDGGHGNTDGGVGSPRDGGTDGNGADACAEDGGCTSAPKGCAAFPEAAFCDDFDNADALTNGKTKWDFIEPSAQPVLTLSTAQAVSSPNALLSRVIDKDTPGAKFAKVVTKAAFTEVTWAYDVYFESIGTADGFFLDDFQFTDDVGADTFGFRLVMFAEASAIKELKVEHNQNVIGGDYVIEPPIAAGSVSLLRWHHFEQTVKFTFENADAGVGVDAGANTLQYALRIDKAATPQFQKEYPGASRDHIDFARIAGMPFVFNKEKSAGLKIHWDNHVLEMK
jgi:hypothetical protein